MTLSSPSHYVPSSTVVLAIVLGHLKMFDDNDDDDWRLVTVLLHKLTNVLTYLLTLRFSRTSILTNSASVYTRSRS